MAGYAGVSGSVRHVYIFIYIYIYIYRYIHTYIYIWHMLTNVSTRVQGHQGGLGWGVGTPPPILRSGNTKKHVLEVNWMVISGY